VTRHPGTGAAGEPAVTVGEPVEKKAAGRKSALCGSRGGECPVSAGELAENRAVVVEAVVRPCFAWGVSVDTPSVKGLTFASWR